jgi:hypothetical protein
VKDSCIAESVSAATDTVAVPIPEGIPPAPELEEWWEAAKTWRAITEENSTLPLVFVSTRYKLDQMGPRFHKIADKIPEFDGDVLYYNGYAIMEIFPPAEEFKIDNTGYRIGICAHNSVNCESAETIKFIITDGQRKFAIPRRLKHFRKIHVGKIVDMADDYINTISQVKDMWTTICDKFTTHEVKLEDLPEMAKAFDLDGKSAKHMALKVAAGQIANLWDYCMAVFDFIETKNFKSDIHKVKRLDQFVETMFMYKIMETLVA